MIALAAWGLAIVRGLTRLWCRITYREIPSPFIPQQRHPHYSEGLEVLKNRREPLQ